MKKTMGILCLLFLLCAFVKNSAPVLTNDQLNITDTIPVALPANFTDDYGIRYAISDTLWFQLPSAKYHIIRWNLEEQYVIAKNGAANPGDGGLYTRIDYMPFKNMEPFLWGFCLSTFDAKSDSLAEFSPTRTDRLNPRKGCNGYPFSRMKKID
jgi:hypothetical protein